MAQPREKKKENHEIFLPTSTKCETDFTIIEPPQSHSVTSASQPWRLRPLATLTHKRNEYSHVHSVLSAAKVHKYQVAHLLHKEAEPSNPKREIHVPKVSFFA